MVGEFLRAELESSRFRKGSLKALDMLGYDEKLLTNPDYANTNENQERAKLLGLTRGWPNEWLFTSFPGDTKWFYVTLVQTELAESYRLKSKSNMSKAERRLSATARAVKDKEAVRNVDPALINQIEAKIVQGHTLPPIILVSSNFYTTKVLVEGHSRSIAYCLVDKKYIANGIPTILGVSQKIMDWIYF